MHRLGSLDATMQIETIPAQRNLGGIERFSLVSGPPARRPPGVLRRAALARIPMLAIAAGVLASAGGIAALVLAPQADARSVGQEASEAAPAQRAASAAVSPAATWVEVNRPIQLFDLAGGAFGKLPLVYRARRRPDGNDRQDYLAYGSFGGATPYLNLSIARIEDDPAHRSKMFVDLARLAAAAGLSVTRSAVPSTMPTRFGAFATDDIVVQHGAKALPCVGFRLQPSEGPVAITGFACGTDSKPVDRAELACVLDRIDLVSAGDDQALRDFFVAAERRRGGDCVGSRLMAGAGSRPSWLDAPVSPPLKRGSRGRIP
jgi:hypothetical protein